MEKINKNKKKNIEKKKKNIGDTLGSGPMEKTQKTKKKPRENKKKQKKQKKQYLGTLGWTPLSWKIGFGPGPIRKTDWKPIASKFLQNKNVILHTDGAKAYKLRVPGVLHDNVVHKKQKVFIKGKATWVKPNCTKIWTHKLPNSKKTLTVKAGTQIIDRFWGHLRTYLKHTARKVGSVAMARKIRAAQWTYWHKGQNAWNATINMLKDLRLR
jgi:hypothetical protein